MLSIIFRDRNKADKGLKNERKETTLFFLLLHFSLPGSATSTFQFFFFFFFKTMAHLWASAKEKVTSLISSSAGADPEPEPDQGLLGTLRSSFAEATQMSRANRYLAAGTFLGVAILFGALSSMFVVISPRKFAALYTLSNLCGLGATLFVVGPAKQCAKMAEPNRAVASLIYLSSAVLTLVAALKLRSLILTLLFALIQFFALIWYVLSYVPYAKALVSGTVSSCFGGGGGGEL